MSVAPTTAAARMRTRPPAVGALIAALATLVMLAGCSKVPTSSASTSHPPSSSSSTSSTSSSTSTTSTTAAPLPLPRAGLGLVKPIVPSASAYFGAWRGPGPGRPSTPETSIELAEDAIGRKYAIDHRYYGWGAVIPTAYESWTAEHGRIPMVSLCACRFADGSVVPWARIAAGQEDAYLNTIAKRFVALNTPAFFLFDAEPETNVGIRGRATDYRAAFRHVVTVFRTAGAKNVAFVWATTAYAFRTESGDRALTASLYPGDDVVDWVASDPYNFANNGDWNPLSYEVDPWYQWATATHPGKPLMLSEWGSKEDPTQPTRKAAWFRSALTALDTRYRKIRAVVYFDEAKAERGTVNDWRIDTSAASLSAFAEIAHAAWFRAHE